MQTIKCEVAGDSSVGRKSLLMTYVTNKFPTKIVSYMFDYELTVMIGGEPYTISLLSTVNSADHDNFRPLNYPKNDVFLVCFSVVSPSSFDNVKVNWVPEIRRHCPKTPFLLVGTKIYLRDDQDTLEKLAQKGLNPISMEQGEQLAEEVKAVKYLECSALTQEGLRNVMDEAFVAALETPQPKSKKCAIS